MKTTFSATVNKQHAYTICLNPEGYYLSVNNIFAHALWKTNTPIQSTFFESVSNADLPNLREVVQQCIETPGEPYSIVLIHSFANSTLSVQWNLWSLLLNDEYIIHGFGQDYKEAKKDSYSGNSHLNNGIPTGLLYNIFNYSLDVICAVDEDGKFVAVSNRCKELWGYESTELIGRKFSEFLPEEDFEKANKATIETKDGKELQDFECSYIRKDGSTIPIIWTAKWSVEDNIMYCVAKDGQRRKLYQSAIKISEEKYKLLFDNNPFPMWIYDQETLEFLEVNEAAVTKYGFTRDEMLSMTIRDIRPKDEIEKLVNFRGGGNDPTSSYKNYWRHKSKTGEIFDVEIAAHEIEFEDREAKLVLANDITRHLKAERELIKSNERYYFATKASFDAIWDWDIVTNELYWSDSYEKLFGYKGTEYREPFLTWLEKVHPDDRKRVEQKFNAALNTNADSWEDEYRLRKTDDTYAYVIDRGIIIRNNENKAYRMVGAIHDYTDKQKNEHSLKQLNESLLKRASELASSNQELERFAYVASHDLQEPLRMVSSFLQLIQKKYKSQLDEKANEYIHFAVDGSERMKVLILDLLKYSRVNTMKEAHEMVDLNEVGKGILLTYNTVANETNATINFGQLPVVLGTKTQLVQLFQNLVGNALKYRGNKAPVIQVSSFEDEESWHFKVEDNGIGIDQRFYEKIFVIFQRLHHKDEYSGTGIGLAICKKIVERHGGKIWVESVKGEGSTFYFTIRKNLKNG